MFQTKRKRREGELPRENQGLPWGEWMEYPYLIRHKGKHYLRLYVDRSAIRTNWYLNGEKIPKNEILDVLLSSEKSNKESTDRYLTLTVNIQSLKI